MNFLRQSHIKSVSVDHIGHDETPAEELWTPYPVQRQPRPCHMSRYFDEACKLSYIARDISWNMSCTHEDAKLKQEMYGRLRDWERELPRIFNPNEKPAPYIIILRLVLALSVIWSPVWGLTRSLGIVCATTR